MPPNVRDDSFWAQSGVTQSIFHLGRFAHWLGHDDDCLALLDELLVDPVLLPSMEGIVANEPNWQTKRFSSVFDMRFFRLALYCAARLVKPRRAIETGVLHGMTSLFLLRALELNGSGRLTSIDLPSFAETGPANRDGYNSTLPPGRQPGWLVPHSRYPDWDLILGSTQERLGTLNNLADLDLFLHDSEHTVETMTFELEWAWPRLADGGLLICDNIEANEAFQDFCRRVGKTPIYFPAPDTRHDPRLRFGMIRK